MSHKTTPVRLCPSHLTHTNLKTNRSCWRTGTRYYCLPVSDVYHLPRRVCREILFILDLIRFCTTLILRLLWRWHRFLLCDVKSLLAYIDVIETVVSALSHNKQELFTYLGAMTSQAHGTPLYMLGRCRHPIELIQNVAGPDVKLLYWSFKNRRKEMSFVCKN
jgi:hypothetical protein